MKLIAKLLTYAIVPVFGGFIVGKYFVTDLLTLKAATVGLIVGGAAVCIVSLGESSDS